MKIRKIVAASAALATSAVLLAGCGGEQQAPETLRILAVKHPLTKPMAEMEWVNQIEEATGATIAASSSATPQGACCSARSAPAGR